MQQNLNIILIIIFLLMNFSCSGLKERFLDESSCFNLCSNKSNCSEKCITHGALNCDYSDNKDTYKYRKCKCEELLNKSQGNPTIVDCEKSKPNKGFPLIQAVDPSGYIILDSQPEGVENIPFPNYCGVCRWTKLCFE